MMTYRRDVAHIAHVLAYDSGLSVQAVYGWLMDVGHDKGTNPCRLEFHASAGRIVLADDPDSYRLESYRPDQRPARDDGAADYWETRIMERQERYLPD